MDKDLLKKLIAEPGKKHQVADFETDDTATLTKDQAKKLLKENIKILASLQDKLYAFKKYAVLIVVLAMDVASKDGTIKNMMSGINPQRCQVFSLTSQRIRSWNTDICGVYRKMHLNEDASASSTDRTARTYW